ncbi:MAG: ABC transporter ATP-binding protein [Parvibaculaceae bacterium]
MPKNGHISRAEAPLIRFERVDKTFTRADGGAFRALDGLSLSIARNEFFTLLGPSGCGKTTLLRLLAGFDRPDSGTVHLDGQDLTGVPANRRPVNTVFQSYALFPHLTVAQNIGFGLRMLGSPASAVERVTGEMLDLVRLSDKAAGKPSQLSGGQQQRVALARALAPSPRVLLLDEPLSALDLQLRKEMQIEMKRIQRETHTTFLFVTHDQEEALTMSDRIAVIDRGRVQQTGSPEEIYKSPANVFVAGFIGEMNFIDIDALHGEGGTICAADTGIGRFHVSVPGNAQACSTRGSHKLAIRPERCRISAGSRADLANSVTGRISNVVFTGPYASIYFKPGNSSANLRIRVTADEFSEKLAAVDADATVTLPAGNLAVLPS